MNTTKNDPTLKEIIQQIVKRLLEKSKTLTGWKKVLCILLVIILAGFVSVYMNSCSYMPEAIETNDSGWNILHDGKVLQWDRTESGWNIKIEKNKRK